MSTNIEVVLTTEQRAFYDAVRGLRAAAFKCQEIAMGARFHIAPLEIVMAVVEKLVAFCDEEQGVIPSLPIKKYPTRANKLQNDRIRRMS